MSMHAGSIRANQSLWLCLVLLLFCMSSVAAYADGTITATIIVVDPFDVHPPPITDLSVIYPTPHSLTLTWTTPGEQGTRLATLYDIRYSLSPIGSEAEWQAASRVLESPTPQLAGSRESFLVFGLTPATTYYFAVKAGYYLVAGPGEATLGWSPLSNCSYGTTLRDPQAGPTTIYLPAVFAAPGSRTVATVYLPTVSSQKELGLRRSGQYPTPWLETASETLVRDRSLAAMDAGTTGDQPSPQPRDSAAVTESDSPGTSPSPRGSDTKTAVGERALDYLRTFWQKLVASFRLRTG